MRTTLFQSFLAKFSPIASFDALTNLYLNDTDLRERISDGKINQVKDEDIRRRLQKVKKNISLINRKDTNYYSMGQLHNLKKPSNVCMKKWSEMMTEDTDSDFDYANDNENTSSSSSSSSTDPDVFHSYKKYPTREYGKKKKRKKHGRHASYRNDGSEKNSACTQKYATRKKMEKNLANIVRRTLRSERKKDDVRLMLSQLVGVERSSVKSVPSNLSQIQRTLADIQARVTTLSERDQRVNVESIYLPQVPGTSKEYASLPRVEKEINSRVEHLLNAKISFEDGDVCFKMRELQEAAGSFWKQQCEHVPNEFTAGTVRRAPWLDVGPPEKQSAELIAAANDIREKTLTLFTTAVVEADKCLIGGALKQRRFVLGRRSSSSTNAPSSDTQIVNLDETDVTIEDYPDWSHIQDDHIEIACVTFERQPQQNQINTCDQNETNGKLRIRFNGPRFFAVAADPDWRPSTTSECENAIYDNAARVSYTQLSNRHTIILKYIAHMFVHVIASMHKNLEGACYNHPNIFEFREIQRYFEPLS